MIVIDRDTIHASNFTHLASHPLLTEVKLACNPGPGTRYGAKKRLDSTNIRCAASPSITKDFIVVMILTLTRRLTSELLPKEVQKLAKACHKGKPKSKCTALSHSDHRSQSPILAVRGKHNERAPLPPLSPPQYFTHGFRQRRQPPFHAGRCCSASVHSRLCYLSPPGSRSQVPGCHSPATCDPR